MDKDDKSLIIFILMIVLGFTYIILLVMSMEIASTNTENEYLKKQIEYFEKIKGE